MRRSTLARFAMTGSACLVWLLSVGRLNGQVPPPPPPPSPTPFVVIANPAGSPALPVPPAPIDPSAPLPSFEVASVKKLPKPATSTTSRSGPGRLMYTNAQLRSLMMLAWGIRDYQIIDAPGWLTADRFSINAKAETAVPRDQVLLMLRSLIVERFNLKYRAEKRELPTYVLVLPGKEWKPNEHMKPCVPRPVTITPALAAAAAAAGVTLPANAQVQGTAPAQPAQQPPANVPSTQTTPPSPPPSRPQPPSPSQSTAPSQANPPSQTTSTPQAGPPSQAAAKPPANPAAPGLPFCGNTLSSANTGLTLTGTTSTLASLLGSLAGLGLVQDRTGLTGTYQFRLDPSVIEGRLSAAMPTTGDSLLPNVSAGGSISSSIQDLGLKLERRKEPVDVLVIESVSQPDED